MRALWLIGMMGSGKTVVGATIARRIGLAFVDTDDRIAAAAAPDGDVFAGHEVADVG